MYLDPASIATIDDLERYTQISRSKIIREVVDRFAESVSKVLAKAEKLPLKKYSLDSLVGAIILKGKKNTNYALKEDLPYLSD